MPIVDPTARIACDICLNVLSTESPPPHVLPSEHCGDTIAGADARRRHYTLVVCSTCRENMMMPGTNARLLARDLANYYGFSLDGAAWQTWDDWRSPRGRSWALDAAVYADARRREREEYEARRRRDQEERRLAAERAIENERREQERRVAALAARPAYARGTFNHPPAEPPPLAQFANGSSPGRQHEDYRMDDVPDHHGTLQVPRMWIPPLKGRDVRLISFEQEIMGDGNGLAEQFHAEGLAEHDFILGYHSRAGGLIKVEEDGSVDAEVIYQKVDLSDREVATNFERGLQIVREAIREGDVRLSGHCGGHIHVDARGLEMRDLLGLYTTWNHAEDVLYRLAAANWRMHRSESGNDYAPTVRKNVAPDDFHRFMYGSRAALNMSPYLQARQSCECGIATSFGAWGECTCDLGNSKPTIEFRVWNATANLRKVRAYAAISIGMLEYARRNRVKAEDFPVNAWSGSEREPTYNGEPLAFILDELPMSRSERRDVRYCAERSTLAAIL